MYGTYLSANPGLISRTLARTFKARRAANAPDPAVVGSAMVYDFSEDADGAADNLIELQDNSVRARVGNAWQQLHGAATRLLEPLAQSTERLRFALR
jgi:hypothetical protein